MTVQKISTPDSPETIEVDTTNVGCDGGGGALGHPRVFIDLAHDGQGKCPYCGTVYRLKAGEKIAHGH